MIKEFVKRHWRGQISLPISYWIIGCLLSSGLVVLTVNLLELALPWAPSLTYTSWFVLSAYLLIVAITIWTNVGIWRASTNHIKAGKSKLWGRLAKTGVIVAALMVSTQAITVHMPAIKSISPFLTGNDPSFQPVEYEILDQGNTLAILGDISNGSSSIISAALDRNPMVTKLYLDSDGGRIKEALKISSEVGRRQLDTYVEGDCLSACTFIFLAGAQRYATPNARIGFHKPALDDDSNKLLTAEVERYTKDEYRKFNVPEEFLTKIFSTPHNEMWFPSHKELVEIGVVTDSTQGGETTRWQKSLNANSATDVKRALLEQPIWQAMSRKLPNVVDEISTQMFVAMKQGKSDADVLNESRKYISPYSMEIIAKSTPKIRADFAELALDQSRHIATLGPEFCKSFVTSSLDVTQVLPYTLVEREVALLQAALESDFIAPSNYSEPAFEQSLGRVMSEMTHAEIVAASDPTAPGTAETCSGLVKFYEGFAKLPAAERDIGFYGLFRS